MDGMRTTIATLGVILSVSLLTACSLVPDQDGDPDAGATTPPTASPTAAPSAEPSATADPPLAAEIPACDELVSSQTMYDYNSNVALTPSYAPPAGSVIARVAETGISCGWTNLSSGEVIALAVGAPDSAAREDFEAEFNALGEEQWGSYDGYFGVRGSEGLAAVIVDGYVVVSSSPTYLEAGDAQPIVEAAISGL